MPKGNPISIRFPACIHCHLQWSSLPMVLRQLKVVQQEQPSLTNLIRFGRKILQRQVHLQLRWFHPRRCDTVLPMKWQIGLIVQTEVCLPLEKILCEAQQQWQWQQHRHLRPHFTSLLMIRACLLIILHRLLPVHPWMVGLQFHMRLPRKIKPSCQG